MQSAIEAAEELFLLGKFQDVLNICEAQLEQLQNARESHLDASGSSSSSLSSGEIIDTMDDSIAPMSLMIQSLFELQRSNEVMTVVQKFYGELDYAPSQILTMCIHLHVSLRNYEKAKSLIEQVLKRHVLPSKSNEFISKEQYEQTLEILLINIYAAQNKHDTALDILSKDQYISDDFKTQMREELLEQKRVAAEEASKASQAVAVATTATNLYPKLDQSTSSSPAPTDSTQQATQSSGASSFIYMLPLSLWKTFIRQLTALRKVFSRQFSRMKMSRRKSLYGVIIAFVFGAVFIFLRPTNVSGDVIGFRERIVQWFLNVLQMIFSIGSGQPARAVASSSNAASMRSFAGNFRQQQLQMRSRF